MFTQCSLIFPDGFAINSGQVWRIQISNTESQNNHYQQISNLFEIVEVFSEEGQEAWQLFDDLLMIVWRFLMIVYNVLAIVWRFCYECVFDNVCLFLRKTRSATVLVVDGVLTKIKVS